MTKNLTAALQDHLAGSVTTLATCWKVTRADTAVLGFTDLDRDLVIDEITFKAATGFTASSVQSKSDFSVDNMELEGVVSSDDIAEQDVLNGKYDYAEVEIFMVNYEDIDAGAIYLKRGRMGEVKVKRGQFIAELRGLAQHLTNHIGRVYTSSCDAILGDARCGVDMSAFIAASLVTGAIDRQTFTATALTQEAGYFTGGELVFTSGLNAGLRMEVKEFENGTIVLALPMPNTVATADAFLIKAGCDKTEGTCKAKFNNLINFRGFAHIPGMDTILQTSGTGEFGDDS
mgnify:CR=1 FL=1|tara:strand:+ start:3268 stop:4131 length:864 start_codon:yes stop_codon:yes gene_type:complete